MAKNTEERVIIEYIPVGKYVKVSAIDPKTRIEVSIVGDPKQGEAVLKRTAVRKLHYVLQKKAQNIELRRRGGKHLSGGQAANSNSDPKRIVRY